MQRDRSAYLRNYTGIYLKSLAKLASLASDHQINMIREGLFTQFSMKPSEKIELNAIRSDL
jgi:hypothetical protein